MFVYCVPIVLYVCPLFLHSEVVSVSERINIACFSWIIVVPKVANILACIALLPCSPNSNETPFH